MGRPDWTVIRRPGSPVLFFICMVTVFAIGWGEDYASCERQIPVRHEINARHRNAVLLSHRLGMPALERNSRTVAIPSCLKPLPDR